MAGGLFVLSISVSKEDRKSGRWLCVSTRCGAGHRWPSLGGLCSPFALLLSVVIALCWVRCSIAWSMRTLPSASAFCAHGRYGISSTGNANVSGHMRILEGGLAYPNTFLDDPVIRLCYVLACPYVPAGLTAVASSGHLLLGTESLARRSGAPPAATPSVHRPSAHAAPLPVCLSAECARHGAAPHRARRVLCTDGAVGAAGGGCGSGGLGRYGRAAAAAGVVAQRGAAPYHAKQADVTDGAFGAWEDVGVGPAATTTGQAAGRQQQQQQQKALGLGAAASLAVALGKLLRRGLAELRQCSHTHGALQVRDWSVTLLFRCTTPPASGPHSARCCIWGRRGAACVARGNARRLGPQVVVAAAALLPLRACRGCSEAAGRR